MRLVSLDAYRGLIMLTLLCGGIFHSLAGHPIWGWLAHHNEHVEWEGAVYWDLIQPAFMFMVGVAMPFAFAARAARGDTWGSQARHALRRAAMLVLIGVLLDHVGADRVQIGFMRVLQQIAVGYLVAFLVLGRSLATQAAVVAVILVALSGAVDGQPLERAGRPLGPGPREHRQRLRLLAARPPLQWLLRRDERHPVERHDHPRRDGRAARPRQP